MKTTVVAFGSRLCFGDKALWIAWRTWKVEILFRLFIFLTGKWSAVTCAVA